MYISTRTRRLYGRVSRLLSESWVARLTIDHPSHVRGRFREIFNEEAQRGREGFLMESTLSRLLASFGAEENVAHIGRAFRQLSIERLTLRPYVPPLFETLRRSYCKLGILSNTEAVLTRVDLDRCPILLSADAIVLSSDVGVRKPDPRIFQIALDRLRTPATAAMLVGNSIAEDIEGARRAGLRAIYLDEEATDVEPFREDPSVLRVPPTRDALILAIHLLGCRPPDPS
jgi:HAD superfamily hydrolase (TIGR01549 family)